MAEVQRTAEHNILANEQQHYEQSESIYGTYLLEKVNRNTTPDSTYMSHRGGEIDQNAEKCQVSCPLLDPSFDNMTTKFSNQFLESENISLKRPLPNFKKTFQEWKHILNEENEHLKQTYKDLSDSIKKTSVQTKDHADSLIVDHADSLIVQLNCKSVENANLKAQIQEKVFANVALINELRKLKGNSMDTKFATPSILGKPVLQPPRNQSVVRKPNAVKSEQPNFSKPRFASQVDVNSVLSKPVTQHYLPKGRESAFAKPSYDCI
ncbi:hypothetical protein Tco_1416306 [Tanacetum coccineum]